MFELVQGRLARALAVLLGIVLWWPAAAHAAHAAHAGLAHSQQSGQPTLFSNEKEPCPDEKLEQLGDVPNGSSEGEGAELDDGSPGQVAILSTLQLLMSTATRIAMLQHALPRLNAGYQALARGRGPPIG
ncbi:hypothetical protein ENSA5_57560 [Enhygromyxa salina]|uniref:Uncharacterized protein n=1 Tax=Enhygromyxa salina TaxID=215803 RepID=A0A2S9XE94_9BACT|nr:hypothetical protein [Enhygromyxa salina]PRP91184.1 hypothetical protein ENSA5_57560 [Enhygromyxa salina]